MSLRQDAKCWQNNPKSHGLNPSGAHPREDSLRGTGGLGPCSRERWPFEVLKDHAPIVASLANPGVLHFRTLDGQAMKFNLLGGVVEVLANKIILLSPGLQQD